MDRLISSGPNPLASNAPECAMPGSLSEAEAALGTPQPSLQDRLARIVRTIEADIIPRLVHAHRPSPAEAPQAPAPLPIEPSLVAPFVRDVMADNDTAWQQTVDRLAPFQPIGQPRACRIATWQAGQRIAARRGSIGMQSVHRHPHSTRPLPKCSNCPYAPHHHAQNSRPRPAGIRHAPRG